VSGDSAGGGLALALVLSLRDAGQELPAGVILLPALLIQAGTDELLAPDAEALAASASAAGVDQASWFAGQVTG
jgi:epsilon-lactone hydrolase